MSTFLFVTKQSFFSSFSSSPITELTESLTSSIGKKHLHPDLPLQLRSMVVLNIIGTAGRRARAQQTRIIRKQLTCKKHWTIVKQHWTVVKAQRLPTCVFYSSGNQMDFWLHRAVPDSALQRKIKKYFYLVWLRFVVLVVVVVLVSFCLVKWIFLLEH